MVLVRFPDRPGGNVRLTGIQVSSVGAGLPLIVIGVVLIAVATVSQERRGDHLHAASCRLHITAPKDGEKIDNRGGTTVEGTACNGDAVWILDDPGGGFYYRENDNALAVVGERWLQEDKRIGAFADPVGTKYRIVAVRVGPGCSGALEAIPRGEDGSVRLRELPAGCPRLESGANVESVIVVKRAA